MDDITPVKSVETWAVHAPVQDNFFIPIGREQQAGTFVPQQSSYKELFTRGPNHFIAGGVLCCKKSLNNLLFVFILLFNQKVF